MKCYLCQTEVKKLLHKNGYDIYKCPNCNLGMTDLHERYIEFVGKQYDKGYFNGRESSGAYVNYKEDKPQIVKNLEKFLAQIKKYKTKGKLLDVGCALGFFVELAMMEGYDAYGFDPANYAVTEARNLVGDKRITQGTIQDVEYEKNTFDVITLCDVFEHLGDPSEDLKKIFSWLKDDGIVLIATGDSDSLAAKTLGRRWTFYIPPQHLFFFDKRNLSRLLSDTGFAPFKWFSIGKWLTLRYLLHLGRTTGESRIARWFYPLVMKSKLAIWPVFVPMHDNMVVIARKAVTS